MDNVNEINPKLRCQCLAFISPVLIKMYENNNTKRNCFPEVRPFISKMVHPQA